MSFCEPNNEDNEGFVLVRNRRQRRLVIRKSCSDPMPDVLFTDQQIIDKINACVERLRRSDFMNAFLNSFDNYLRAKSRSVVTPFSAIVCLGLGNFWTSRCSRYQLALLLLIKQLTKCHTIRIYDPIFSDNEKHMLKETFGMRVMEWKEESSYGVECFESVLFYMPHCHKSLFNNVLHANWKASHLDRIYILGNSFNNMLHTISGRLAIQLFSYLYNICNIFSDAVIEHRIKNNFTHKEIFNDLSFHAFKAENISDDILGQHYNENKPLYDNEAYDYC